MLTTLLAFANTAGGILPISIEDGTRRVIGVPDILATEERLASVIADSIRPRLVPDIGAKIAVEPSSRDPGIALPVVSRPDNCGHAGVGETGSGTRGH